MLARAAPLMAYHSRPISYLRQSIAAERQQKRDIGPGNHRAARHRTCYRAPSIDPQVRFAGILSAPLGSSRPQRSALQECATRWADIPLGHLGVGPLFGAATKAE